MGWTNSTSIDAPYLTSAGAGTDETEYVRVRGVGLLRGDWVTVAATRPAAETSQYLEFVPSTGALQVGSETAAILYQLSGWITFADLAGSPLVGSVALGELPANHVVTEVFCQTKEVFNGGGSTFSLGWSAAGNEQKLVTDKNTGAGGTTHTIDGTHANAGAQLGKTQASAQTLTLYVDTTDATNTTGKLLCVAKYVVVDATP